MFFTKKVLFKNYYIKKKFSYCVPLKFGIYRYNLNFLSSGWVTSEQLEAFRFFLRKFIKGFGLYKFYLYAQHDKFINSKSVRMGKGKGAICSKGYFVFPNCLLVSISLDSKYILYYIVKQCQIRFGIKIGIFDKETS